MIGNRLALLCLVLVLLSVASSLDLEHAKQKPSGSSALSPGPKPNGLDKLKGIFTKAVDKGKQIIAGIRAAIKKDIDEVKLWWKKKFADIKQLYQYSRHCLNEKAPKSLKIKVQNSALCATVRKAHPKFTAFLDKIVDKLPEPSLDETMNAELEGEAQRKHSLIELDASQSVPGDDTRKWPSTLISYALSPNLDPRAVVSFQWGINHIESVTCIRFQQVDINSNHTQGVMRVWPDTGAFVSACAAELGFRGAAGNNVWWASTCSAGTAVHEILHALGSHHTMARLDRDEYITVNLTRILPKAHSNFAKTTSPFKDYGPYDFKSILHYAASAGGFKAFPGMAEKLNRPASVPAALNSPWDGEAQRDALSPGDIDAVKKMYCPNGSGAGSATGSGLASGSGSGSV